ncbi:MAG: hypothetical protein OFPII_40420 [Osedax symbiont Rs1]|nr:MAG: hypothetical protein OFPII_40420 [Osedax symbiont Rs1]
MTNQLNNSRKLWNRLQEKHLIDPQALFSESPFNPWYIRLLQGFAGWLAACFLFAFIAIALFFSDVRSDDYLIILMIGLGCCGFSLVIFRQAALQSFLQQLALAFNLCGQLLVALGLSSVFGMDSSSFFIYLAAFQLTQVALQNDFTTRLLSTWFACIALYFGLSRLGFNDIGLALCYMLFALVWLTDQKWAAYQRIWEPVGYGLAIAFLSINSHFLSPDLSYLIERVAADELLTPTVSFWLNQGLIAAIFIVVLHRISATFGADRTFKTKLGVLIAALLILAISYLVLGASAGFLLIMLGFMKQRKILVMLGVVFLLSFLSVYYYSLNWNFLYKSGLLFGLSILFTAVLCWFKYTEKADSEKLERKKSGLAGLNIMAALWVLCVLVVINVAIFQKEQILKNGDIALLALVPVDPRSLMQGDYMNLRFKIERTVLEASRASAEDPEQGYFVVNLDAQQVASFAGSYQGQALAENQLKMLFRIRGNRLKLATHAFFFEEGSAALYENAKYGEFRVDSKGHLLLNNLRDAEYKILGFNRPSH